MIAAVVVLLAMAPAARGEDRIYLRNLEVIRGRTVVAADINGVRLDDQSVVRWDQIDEVRVAGPMKKRVDQLFEDLGGPLFRIRQRMSVGDYSGLRALAVQVQPYFAKQTGATALMVSQAWMWGALHEGRREEALLGHLQTCRNLQADAAVAKTLPGKRPLGVDLKTGLSDYLLPVWFDEEAARSVQPRALRLAASLASPRPAAIYFYCATLSLAAGQPDQAQRMIGAVVGQGRGRHWREIFAMQQHVIAEEPGADASEYRAKIDEFQSLDRVLALYWLGRRELLRPATAEQGMLDLLRISAAGGEQFPELAAAALHVVVQHLEAAGRPVESVRVRRELLENYPQTHYARARKSTPAGDTPSAGAAAPRAAEGGEP